MYKRLYYNSVVTDKLIVEVIKAEEGLDPFYGTRGFPVADSFHLLRVNFDSFHSNDKPEVLYIFYPKFIFLNINL